MSLEWHRETAPVFGCSDPDCCYVMDHERGPHCTECCQEWPCDVEQLRRDYAQMLKWHDLAVARAEAAEAEIAELREAIADYLTQEGQRMDAHTQQVNVALDLHEEIRTLRRLNQSLALDLSETSSHATEGWERAKAAEIALDRVLRLVDEADGDPSRTFWPSEILAAIEGTER